MGNGITLYGSIVHQDSDYQPRRDFREWAIGNGFRYGVWSWNLTEMEIDQLAISASDLLTMILPHLAQIREFAEFRLRFPKTVAPHWNMGYGED